MYLPFCNFIPNDVFLLRVLFVFGCGQLDLSVLLYDYMPSWCMLFLHLPITVYIT